MEFRVVRAATIRGRWSIAPGVDGNAHGGAVVVLDRRVWRRRRCRAVTRRLGNYELLKKIGSGGMAEVWMGRQVALGGFTSAVAVKLIKGDMAGDPHYRRMFVAEARISALLRHQNIVRVQNVGEEDGELYLVMDWVDGMNLAQLATLMRDAEQPMPLAVIGFVVGELLRGLAFAHTVTHEGAPLGVVHRDVSPQNVLISVSGEVMLADFGVARLAEDETSHTHTARGKVRYMSPEQLGGLDGYKAPTVDLYAVGAILHELLDGRKFRRTDEQNALASQVLAGIVPELDSVHVVPPELDGLRRALLRPDPKDRPASASVALKMLSRWSGYRNAAEELGALCGSFMGVEAPRSGIYEPAMHGSGSVATVQLTESPPQMAQTRTRVDPSGPPAASVPGPGRWRLAAGFGLGAVLAAGAAVFAMGRPAAPPEGVAASDPVQPVAESQVPPATGQVEPPSMPVESAPVAGLPPGPAAAGPGVGETPSTMVAGGATTDGPESVTGTGSGPQEDPGDPEARPTRRRSEDSAPRRGRSRRPEANPVAPPIDVLFALSGPAIAYVRIDGGKPVLLEPRKTLSIVPGRHRIRWRTSTDEPWQDAGMFELTSGYKIVVTSHGPKKFKAT